MKGMTTMYDHRGKRIGLIVSAIGLAGMIIEKFKGLVLVKKWDSVQHYAAFEWVMLAGLFLVIFSKEKYDDERAKAIRLKSFQMSFAIQQAVLLGVALTATTAKDKAPFEASDLFVVAAMGILFYLFMFNIGLYFDVFWEYEDKSVWENIKNIGRNKWAKLVYLLGCAIMLLILSML